mmetsp:Transcript_15575/g.42267  ORF Transcript_15575/g.42267 Transcript_15575/m.42267 type:complete len:249 (-) Transcript_15575:550-1296(-)
MSSRLLPSKKYVRCSHQSGTPFMLALGTGTLMRSATVLSAYPRPGSSSSTPRASCGRPRWPSNPLLGTRWPPSTTWYTTSSRPSASCSPSPPSLLPLAPPCSLPPHPSLHSRRQPRSSRQLPKSYQGQQRLCLLAHVAMLRQLRLGRMQLEGKAPRVLRAENRLSRDPAAASAAALPQASLVRRCPRSKPTKAAMPTCCHRVPSRLVKRMFCRSPVTNTATLVIGQPAFPSSTLLSCWRLETHDSSRS